MRLAALACLAALALAPQAGAQIRLSEEPSRVHALTVADGIAVALLDSGDPSKPFTLVRSSGVGRSVLGDFGRAGGEFPDVAADAEGRLFASWLRPVSGGAIVEVVRAGAEFGPSHALALATAPARLAVVDGAAIAAFSDQKGDVAVQMGEAAMALTASAPARRHLPVELVLADALPPTPLVLDLVQSPDRTELRVVGPGAPGTAIVTVPALRNIPAALASGEGGVVAAYLSGGRAVLARPRPDGSWTRRRLPGPGGGSGAPALVLTEGRAIVAYVQTVRVPGRLRGQREIYLAEVRGGTVRARRLTENVRDDSAPVAAAGPAGEAYVAWVRRERGDRVALLERLD